MIQRNKTTNREPQIKFGSENNEIGFSEPGSQFTHFIDSVYKTAGIANDADELNFQAPAGSFYTSLHLSICQSQKLLLAQKELIALVRVNFMKNVFLING